MRLKVTKALILNASFRTLSNIQDGGGHGAARHLAGVRLRNFKGFKEIDVSLGEFNLLVGSNNSGKSTILQAIKLGRALLRQHFVDPNSAAFKKGRTFPVSLLPVAEPPAISGTRTGGVQETLPSWQRLGFASRETSTSNSGSGCSMAP